MCGACGLRPSVDWYTAGVPVDRAGRVASLQRLAAVVDRAVSAHAGRVTTTLAGTALLISSPSGASRIATGVPDAAEAVASLFSASRGRVPLAIGGVYEPTVRTSRGVRSVDVALPPGIGWEAFSWWLAMTASRDEPRLRTASAEIVTAKARVSVQLDDAGLRAKPVPPQLGDGGHVQLVFDDADPPPSPADVLRSIQDLTIASVANPGK